MKRNECIVCNKEAKLLVRVNHNSSWANSEYCASCAFNIFKGINKLKSGVQITNGNYTHIVIEVYDKIKKYNPLILKL